MKSPLGNIMKQAQAMQEAAPPDFRVEFDFNGEHSPLGIKVKGGTSADTLTGSTETLLARLEQAERGTTESL